MGKKVVNFNCLYVLESLPASEPKTGSNLYHYLKPKIAKVGYGCKRYSTITKEDFGLYLDGVYQDVVDRNYFPIIHFEIHGDENGLILESGDIVTWKELSDKLREINKACENNLLLTLAVCNGAYFFRTINIMKLSPCWGFIGPWEKEPGYILSDKFKHFYDYVFKKRTGDINLNMAIKLLHIGDVRSDHILNFYNSEHLFDKIWSGAKTVKEKGKWIDDMTYKVMKMAGDVRYIRKVGNQLSSTLNRWNELGEDFKLFFTGEKDESEETLLRRIIKELFK